MGATALLIVSYSQFGDSRSHQTAESRYAQRLVEIEQLVIRAESECESLDFVAAHSSLIEAWSALEAADWHSGDFMYHWMKAKIIAARRLLQERECQEWQAAARQQSGGP